MAGDFERRKARDAYGDEGWANGSVAHHGNRVLAEPSYRTPAIGTSVTTATRFSGELGR